MKRILVLVVVLFVLAFASTAFATMCFSLNSTCELIYVDIIAGQIVGYYDNCTGTPEMLVGGWLSYPTWTLFVDADWDEHAMEYMIMRGTRHSGDAYAYNALPDGSLIPGFPIPITLVPCPDGAAGGNSTVD